MRVAGDLFDNERKLIPELLGFESSIDIDTCTPNDGRAMMYVCLAHDWYHLDMEEEGNRLLIKADKVCPGYFTGSIEQHMKENANFKRLVENLTKGLIFLLKNSLEK